MAYEIKVRHILCAMVFWGQIQNYMMRANLSLLIVAMIKDKPIVTNSTGETTISVQNMTCMANRDLTTEEGQKMDQSHLEEMNQNKFDWDEIVRGHVLSAFSIGYILTQIIGGRLTG